MNETSLMKVVEQAVRPVRAGKAAKLRMRRELLGHLQAIFEEERVRIGDEGAAFAEARQRFGDPTELSHELDRSVGFRGRWAWGEDRFTEAMERVLCYREDRSLAWHIGRTILTTLGAGVLGAALFGLLTLAVPEWRTAAALLPVLSYFLATVFIFQIASFAFVTDFYDLERPRWLRALLHGAACVAATTGAFYAMQWALTDDMSPLLPELPLILAVHALIPAGLVFVVWSTESKDRPYREWARLELDE